MEQSTGLDRRDEGGSGSAEDTGRHAILGASFSIFVSRKDLGAMPDQV